MIKRLSIVVLATLLMMTVKAQVSFADSIMEMQDSLSANLSADEEEVGEELYDTILKLYPIDISPDTVAYWKQKKEFAYVKNWIACWQHHKKKKR